ncbi:hypothetical protein [Nocardia cyriacigeorgica]|uniref:hypothetical protein n=1 Tax=Nocardia cyriacigeorgica TaxID=135487 RepID=UPI001319EAF4|nr:hypothetical protein [Nocardia cyriacigeorgica]
MEAKLKGDVVRDHGDRFRTGQFDPGLLHNTGRSWVVGRVQTRRECADRHRVFPAREWWSVISLGAAALLAVDAASGAEAVVVVDESSAVRAV